MTDLFGTKGPVKSQIIIEEYMMPSESAHAFHVPTYVIKNGMDYGHLEMFLINGKIKVKSEEVRKFLEERAKKRAS
jgi:hypothetical protein